MNKKGNLQIAVLSCVDSKTVTLLVKLAPDMLMHTETDPTTSNAVKEGAENPTLTPAIHIRQNSTR